MNLVGYTFSTCAHLTTNQVSHRHTGTSPYNTRTSPTTPSIIHVSNVGLYYRVGLYKDPIIETIWGILLPVNKLEIVFAGICNHHTNRPVGRCLALLWVTDVWRMGLDPHGTTKTKEVVTTDPFYVLLLLLPTMQIWLYSIYWILYICKDNVYFS